jgi:hypothetical protein
MSIELVLNLSDEAFAAAKVAADKAGLTVEQWAAERLSERIDPPGLREDARPFDDARDLLDRQTPEARAFQRKAAAETLVEYDRTGISYPLEDVLREFRADVEAGLARKGSL